MFTAVLCLNSMSHTAIHFEKYVMYLFWNILMSLISRFLVYYQYFHFATMNVYQIPVTLFCLICF